MKSFKELLYEDAPAFDLKKYYDEYNNLYFDGELPEITLRYKNIRPHGVCVSFQNRETKLLRLDRIEISNKYHMSYENFRNILVHEMIHAYLSVNQMTEREMHGIKFRRVMRQINNAHPELDVALNAEMEGIAQQNKKTFDVFLVDKHRGPNQYIIVTCKPENSDEWLDAIIRRYYGSGSGLTYLRSDDDNLLAFPVARKSNTIKFYVTDKTYYDHLLATGSEVRALPSI